MTKLKKITRRKAAFRDSTGTAELNRNHRLARARMLDRLADAELQHGHHGAAERFAYRADELRGVAE